MHKLAAIAVALLAAASQPVAAALGRREPACPGPAPSANPKAASGVGYKVLLNDLSRPRGVTVDSEGNLLLVEGRSKGVTRVVLNDAEGLDVCVDSSDLLIDESSLNHGIALSGDGKTLFVSSSTDVYAYSYDAAAGTVGDKKNIITGMEQGGHSTRTLLVPRQNPDLLLVSRGSDGNVDEPTVDIKSGRSQLRIFMIADLMDADEPVEYTSGEVLGWGLRNSVGIADDPTTGNVWSVENSLDNMNRNGEDIHNTNPGEELNFHGRPNDTDGDAYGHNFGYPGCLAIFDPSNVSDYPGGADVGKQMTGDHMDDFTDEYCRDETMAPRITFGSHLAPLDIKFLDDGSAALIAFHGSWNRKPPNGYRLSRVSFSKGMPTSKPNANDAEEHLMWNADNADCPGSCFRPVGLVLGKGGRVYMTSDSSGELYVVTGTQKQGAPNTMATENPDAESGAKPRMSLQFGQWFW